MNFEAGKHLDSFISKDQKINLGFIIVPFSWWRTISEVLYATSIIRSENSELWELEYEAMSYIQEVKMRTSWIPR